MSAAEALKAARAAGIQIGIDGDDLVLEATVPPPAAVIDLLSRHKAEIVALLRPVETAGRPRTGRPSLKSGPGSLSSMADCLVRRPRPRPSTAALLNG